MQDINKKIVIFTLIAVILIGTITFVLIKGINERNSEPLIGIDGVNFTLNNIKDNFLNSEYAQNNDCTGSVSEDTILITCNSNKYNFTFNKFELELDSSYEESKEVFKYIVNTIEELHGYQDDEYLETMDKFFAGEVAITGLEYINNNGNRHYSVYVLEQLDKYEANNIETTTVIKDITDNDYIFQSLGYTINNIEVIKDDDEYLVIFSGVIGGQETYDVVFTVNYYDDNNNLITTKNMDLSTHDAYGNPYLGFVVTERLENQNIYDSITKYSISLAN